MGWTDNAKDGMLGQVRTRISHLSLHTAQPDGSGSSEVSGNGYARATVTTATDLAAASGGEFTLLNDKPFSGPANGEATHLGVWDSTTFLGSGELSGDVLAFNAEGDAILKAGTTFDLNLDQA